MYRTYKLFTFPQTKLVDNFLPILYFNVFFHDSIKKYCQKRGQSFIIFPFNDVLRVYTTITIKSMW